MPGSLGSRLSFCGEVGGGLLEAFDVGVVFEHVSVGTSSPACKVRLPLNCWAMFVVAVGVGVAGEDVFHRFADEGLDQLVFGAFFFGEQSSRSCRGSWRR